MQICVLMGSPHLNGNTATLCKPFINELKANRADVDYIELCGKNIATCFGCFRCQDVESNYGCALQDDMQTITKSIIQADILVYATPIYTWQAAPPLKVVLDRMFGFNKYYGKAPRQNLLKAKAAALLTTCGYKPEYAADLLDAAIERLCKHSNMSYAGMLAVCDDDFVVCDDEKDFAQSARDFARNIMQQYDQ